MIAIDKLMHFSVNFLTVVIVGLFNLSLGLGLAIGLSVGKEYGDYHNPNSNGYMGDLVADSIGIVAGVATLLLIKKLGA